MVTCRHVMFQISGSVTTRSMDPEDLLPVPQWTTACGAGFGLAASLPLGVLVTSDVRHNTLSVWSLPGNSTDGNGLDLVYTLGGHGSPEPMRFLFANEEGYSGFLAFASRLLLVTDCGHDTVHMVDVASRAHVGYLAAPGSITGPRGVAANGTLVAVSAWKTEGSEDHMVHIYRSVGTAWTHVRAIGAGGTYFGSEAAGWLTCPYGVRFSADGSAICVADAWNDRVSLFRVSDGWFIRHIATGLNCPYDVEEVEEGVWAACCRASHTVKFVSNGDEDISSRWVCLGNADEGCKRPGEFDIPTTLTLVPGLGLIVREWGNERFQVFSTLDVLAMHTMSAIRVGWMAATYRAIVNRESLLGSKRRRQC